MQVKYHFYLYHRYERNSCLCPHEFLWGAWHPASLQVRLEKQWKKWRKSTSSSCTRWKEVLWGPSGICQWIAGSGKRKECNQPLYNKITTRLERRRLYSGCKCMAWNNVWDARCGWAVWAKFGLFSINATFSDWKKLFYFSWNLSFEWKLYRGFLQPLLKYHCHNVQDLFIIDSSV